jgi:hypothetical protein
LRAFGSALTRQRAAGRSLGALVTGGVLALLATAAPAAGQTPSGAAAGAETSQWPHTLPFLSHLATDRGYELPLPLGLSGIFYYVERDIEITDVRLGVDGAPLRSVSKFLTAGSTSHVSVAVARIDAWLLPFLNVYGMVGYVANNTTTRGEVTIPRPGPLPGERTFMLTAKTELEGFMGGGGLTLAAGYRSFFVMGDVNYSQTDIGFDDRFKALIGSVRAGWNGKILDVPVRLWVGGVYWGTRSTARSSVDVVGVGKVSFEADQGPDHPLNAMLGAQVTLAKHWDLFAEYGTNAKDVQTIAAGLTFRF